MKRVHLLGHPVSQSVSPAMQNAAFASLGLDWEYTALDVAPDDLVRTLEQLEADPDVVGCNVTVPHKIAVFEWLTNNHRSVRDGAQRARAVNTLFRRGNEWVGETTDFYGAFDALVREIPELDLTGQFDYDVAIIGTGGSAQTIALGFANFFTYPRSLAIFGRNLSKAENLAALARSSSPASISTPHPSPVPIDAFDLAGFEEWNRGRKSIVFQTTTVGMISGDVPEQSPVPFGSIGAGQVAFDLVYKPHDTRFLIDAATNNAKIVHGIKMLIGQGARSAEDWIRSTNDYTGPAYSNTFLTSAMERALRDKGLL